MSSRQKLGLFLAVFFAYFLSQSRELPWNDGRRIYQVAESIVHRGTVEVAPPGIPHNGRFYAVNPFVPSLIHVPGSYIHKKLRTIWPAHTEPLKALGCHLGPSALGALVCLLFALLCLDLGVSVLATNLAVVALGFCTMIWVYARSPWSEISQAAAFLGFFLWLLRLMRRGTPAAAAWLGLWAGLLINTKVVYVLALPGAALLAGLHVHRTRGPRRLAALLPWATLGFLPGLVMTLVYNHVRTGSVFNVGYNVPASLQASGSFAETPFWGLYGLLLSPGKSLLLYSPPLLAALLALAFAVRHRDRQWLWAFLLSAGPVLLINARYLFWSGDWCWGPRYLLFLVPPLLLPAVFALDHLLAIKRRAALTGAALVCAAGLFVQVLGNAFYWDHFIRISQDARNRWLGSPNRSGAASPDRGGACDPCFEDFYPFNWLPSLTPIEGHYWLLRHVPFAHDWRTAEADAPWHRYTTLTLNVAGNYSRARVDWWFLDWRGVRRPAGIIVLSAMLAGLAGSSLLWWGGRRRRRQRAGSAPPVSDGPLLGT
jgi:hypothetical protein